MRNADQGVSSHVQSLLLSILVLHLDGGSIHTYVKIIWFLGGEFPLTDSFFLGLHSRFQPVSSQYYRAACWITQAQAEPGNFRKAISFVTGMVITGPSEKVKSPY